MQPSFELFDHTADLGVRAQAPTLAELVTHAIAGLYATIGELAGGDVVATRTLTVRGDDQAVMLRDLLAELLYVFESEGLIACDPIVESFTGGELRVQAGLAPLADGSTCDREVKAVTYHELSLLSIPGGYEAVYIVDI